MVVQYHLSHYFLALGWVTLSSQLDDKELGGGLWEAC